MKSYSGFAESFYNKAIGGRFGEELQQVVFGLTSAHNKEWAVALFETIMRFGCVYCMAQEIEADDSLMTRMIVTGLNRAILKPKEACDD